MGVPLRHRIAASLVVVAAGLSLGGCAAVTASGDASAPTASAYDCSGPRTAVSATPLVPMSAPTTVALPVTVTDESGTAVTVTDTSRILALDTYGTLATTVYALGLGDRLVGRDISTTAPALASLPVVTHNGHQLSAEAILALDPTVVLTDYSIGPLEVQLQLRDAGIPVVIGQSTRSRATIAPQIEAVAAALGVPEQGRALAARVTEQTREAESESVALASRAGTRPRVVFLYVRGQAGIYYWFGRGTGADDLIDALGAVDVATQEGLEGEQPLNAEAIVAAAPDVFLVMTTGLRSVGGVTGLRSIPGIGDTPAGNSGCVIDMADSEVLGFGPQFPATLRALANALYGAPAAEGS